MEATTYSNFRNKLKSYIDKATNDYEPITIIRKDNRNAVLISAEEYNNMKENQFILGNPNNLKWLEESKMQAENGDLAHHKLLEDEDE